MSGSGGPVGAGAPGAYGAALLLLGEGEGVGGAGLGNGVLVVLSLTDPAAFGDS